MATPAGDSYQCASGGVIAGGRPVGRAGDIVVAGDSLTDWTPGYTWGLPLSGSPCRLIYNAGVASNTLDDLWARWGTDVIGKNPGIVMLRIGTNSLGLDSNTFRSKYQLFLSSLVANGIYGVIHALPPRQGIPGSVITDHNAWIAAQCAADSDNLCFVDDSVELGDASYAYLPAYMGDGVHMSAKGMHAQGCRMAPVLRAVFTTASPLIADGSDTYAANPATSQQYVSNPLMSGSAQLPDGWAVVSGGSGTVAVGSKIAADAGDANQTPWLRTVIQSTGGVGHWVSIATTLAHPAIPATTIIKRLDMVAEVRLTNLSGAAIQDITMECADGSNRVGPPLKLMLPSDETISHTLILRSSLARGDEYPVAAHSANSIVFGFAITTRVAVVSPVGIIDVRNVSVRAQGD